jgi:hypothetical protein
MRLMLATLSTMVLSVSAAAQSDIVRAGGAEFSGFNTYWTEKHEGCQPMISFTVKNSSSGDIGPVEFRMEVVDNDRKSVFAGGSASMSSTDLPPGHTKEIAIGGDHDITLHDCMGDMHEAPFSSIHFAIGLSAKIGHDSASVEIVRDQPMKGESVPAKN